MLKGSNCRSCKEQKGAFPAEQFATSYAQCVFGPNTDMLHISFFEFTSS
jgi:hypothetical protein